MLGLLAPVGGALYDRFGARVVTASGMLICVAGLVVLYAYMDGTAANLPFVMLALATVRHRPGSFHLAEQQRDHGHGAGGTDRRGRQPR